MSPPRRTLCSGCYRRPGGAPRDHRIRPRPRVGRVPRVLVAEDHCYPGGPLRDALPQGGFEVSLVDDTVAKE